jgi:hypothetical protein
MPGLFDGVFSGSSHPKKWNKPNLLAGMAAGGAVAGAAFDETFESRR